MLFWLIPVVCGILAAILVVAGAIPVARNRRTLQDHLSRVQAAVPAFFDLARVERAGARITADLAAAQKMLDRAATALREVADGLRELRLREAMIALRVAAIAVRTLRHMR